MQLLESQSVALPAATLTGLIERARTTLAEARGAAEILEARDKAAFAYDAAKSAARIGRAKQAHDEVITATYRVQANALEIEADAKRRLADEYDAAQERGEVARVGDNQHSQGVSVGNSLGISRKIIFEGRQIAEAEQIAPGVVRQTLDGVVAAGGEPNKTGLRRAVEGVIRGDRALMSSRLAPPDDDDFYATPPWATRSLMEHVWPVLGNPDRSGICWEPSCGEGHMAQVLRDYFKHVLASDLVNRGYGVGGVDFLSDHALSIGPVEWVVSNPPFADDSTEKFVLRALQLARTGVAVFTRLQWLESVGRYEAIFRDNPPTLIAFFAERVPLHKGTWKPRGATASAYIWLVWVKGMAPLPPFWIPPGQRKALTRADDTERFRTAPITRAGATSVPIAKNDLAAERAA
jgi:hypothetical protein